jgi:hypothetical protein
VTAVNDSDVWAVGTYGDTAGFFHPLIEHWNGQAWSAQPITGLDSADGILTEVTSAGQSGVWATGQISGDGSDRQVLLHLVGTHWVVAPGNVVRTPGRTVADAFPMAVAASTDGPWVAGNDRAGSSGFSTLAEAPGSAGRLTELTTPNPTPQDNYLQAIAPVNGGQDAWAVGDSVPPSTTNAASLIEYGSATGNWKVVPSPDPGAPNGNTILDGILAFSNDNIWAVGTYDGQGGMKTLVLHYTG